MQSLPVLYIKAKNHYEVGKTIGSTFKHQIHEYLRISKFIPKLQKFYNSEHGKAIYDEYLKTTSVCFPETIQEMQGLADGSKVGFDDIFLSQLLSEILFIHENENDQNEKYSEGSKPDCTRCSDVLVNNKGFRMIAHNEDWDREARDLAYFIHVSIQNESSNTHVEEFASFVVPGELPGLTFGMNKHLVLTINTLLPIYVNRNSVPVAILLRKLLTCRSVDECFKMMTNDPYGCAYGINVNIASIHGNNMCTLEVYPEKDGSTKVSIQQVGNSPDSSNHVYHFNHYTHTPGVKELDMAVNSKPREERAIQFKPPETDRDVRCILGDVANISFPIYKNPSVQNKMPGSRTIATAVFNITEKKLDIYRSCPKGTSNPCVSIPL